MIDDELAANTSLTWMLRAGGWFMMFMGLYMMTSFINYLGKFNQGTQCMDIAPSNLLHNTFLTAIISLPTVGQTFVWSDGIINPNRPEYHKTAQCGELV